MSQNKNYYKALNEAKEILNSIDDSYLCTNFTKTDIRNLLARCFSELQETKEEKIKRTLIEFLDDIWERGKNANFDKYQKSECAEWINWLSKVTPPKPLKPEKDSWYVCIKDFWGCGKRYCSVGDTIQAKGGMYIMCREDISEWFRKAYFDEIPKS